MRSKGRAFVNVLDYIKESYGEESLNSFLYSNPDFLEYKNYCVAAWYPAEKLEKLCAALENSFKEDNILENMGRFSAERDIQGPHRLFSGLGPAFLIKHAFPLLSSYFSLRKLDIINEGAKKYSIIAERCNLYPKTAKKITGWLRHFFVLNGSKNVAIKREFKENKLYLNVSWD